MLWKAYRKQELRQSKFHFPDKFFEQFQREQSPHGNDIASFPAGSTQWLWKPPFRLRVDQESHIAV